MKQLPGSIRRMSERVGKIVARETFLRLTVLDLGLILLFTFVFVANSWLSDDAYISFRAADNLVNGYGLRWNVDERVQAFTNPLWTLLVAGMYGLTGDMPLSAYGISFLLGVLTLAVACRLLRDPYKKILLTLLLLTSKAFVDYTSSGLENPLSYFLLALFTVSVLKSENEPISAALLARLYLIASLAFLNRPDNLLLCVFPLVFLTYRAFLRFRFRIVGAVLFGLLPIFIWECFSIIYYGFALPNTYYAKVLAGTSGLTRWTLAGKGLAYHYNLFAQDPISALLILLSPLTLIGGSRRLYLPWILCLAGYCAYVISIGGDFMGGRFFSILVLLSSVYLLHRFAVTRMRFLVVCGGIVAYTVVMPLVPAKSGPLYEGYYIDPNGIADERDFYFRGTTLVHWKPGVPLIWHEWYRQGTSFSQDTVKVRLIRNAGFLGYAAGPSKHIVDRYALTDPLLARLTPAPDSLVNFRIGHIPRKIPSGYLESLRSSRNLIVDQGLHAYLDQLWDITRGPLFSSERWRAIVEFNLGGKRVYEGSYQ
jgi:arabinofuranosyltransferase